MLRSGHVTKNLDLPFSFFNLFMTAVYQIFECKRNSFAWMQHTGNPFSQQRRDVTFRDAVHDVTSRSHGRCSCAVHSGTHVSPRRLLWSNPGQMCVTFDAQRTQHRRPGTPVHSLSSYCSKPPDWFPAVTCAEETFGQATLSFGGKNHWE